MKRIAAAFTALFVLASCLMAGGSIYMHAHRNDLEITGEVLYGERAMASGVEVRQSVLIDGHPNWEVSYSPAAASHVTRAGWSLPELRRTAAQPPAISIGSITSGLTISYDSGRSVIRLYDIPVVQEIADGIAASAAGSGEYATEPERLHGLPAHSSARGLRHRHRPGGSRGGNRSVRCLPPAHAV